MAEDILGDGRLLKRLVVEGRGPRPAPGTRVQVHCEGHVVSSGARFESSRERGAAVEFELGAGRVIEAWDAGVATMRPGETSDFIVDPTLAYGEEGSLEVPAGATLRFSIELLAGDASEDAGPADKVGHAGAGDRARLERAREAKERGNQSIQEGQIGMAQDAYREALSALAGLHSGDFELLKERNSLRLSCLLNAAHCDLKHGNFSDAVSHATEALDIDPQSCKALYRRGAANVARGRLAEGRADLAAALRLDPQNAEIRARLRESAEERARCEDWDRTAYGGMFGRAPEQRQQARGSLAGLPRVWLDFQIGAGEAQRVHIALYSDSVPRTAENFRALCTGERGVGRCGQPLHFKHTLVHKVVRGSLIEAGDIENYDGSGGESIYGPAFPDEAFRDSHSRRGLLSMASDGCGGNNSKFFITLRSLPQFDRKHVVFGEVVGDCRVLSSIEALETKYPDRPITQVAIVGCGEG